MTGSDASLTALRELVADQIAAQPFLLDGCHWCALPQPDMAEKLGISIATLRRLASKPPFVREWALVDGKKTMLLREGDPTAMTPRHMARILEKIWKQKTGRSISPEEWGMLNGLAKGWPDGYEIALMKYVLEDWKLFMSAVKYLIELDESEAELEGKPPTLYRRFYRYPSIPVVLRFRDAAIEAYEIHLQEHTPSKWPAFAKAVAELENDADGTS